MAGPVSYAEDWENRDDLVIPFAVEGLDVRGRVVHLGPVVDQILKRHAYPAPVSRLLGEAIALTALLGTALKFEGRLILQTKTDGPVDLIVVDYQAPDAVRAYARFDADRVAAAEAAQTAKPGALLGNGILALTIDQGADMARYQGIVELDGASLEEVAHRYFAQSEQIPTFVRLAVGERFERQAGGAPAHHWRAGGVMIQFLPESGDRIVARDLHPGDAPESATGHDTSEDDAWVEARALVETVEDQELIDPAIAPERLLYRLFHERGARVFDAQPITDRCRCSRDRLKGILGQFSAEEITDMTLDDGRITVTCEFCSTTYVYEHDEIGSDGPV